MFGGPTWVEEVEAQPLHVRHTKRQVRRGSLPNPDVIDIDMDVDIDMEIDVDIDVDVDTTYR